MKEKVISIRGINEEKDVKLVEEALYDVWGVTQVDVSFRQSKANVVYDEAAASEIDIEQAIVDQGFQVERGGKS